VTEYTGQLLDGPDEGNLITSTVERVPFQCSYTYWPDGPDKKLATITVYGDYVWDENDQAFNWELDYSE
jgi:hypothetical protein